jgi:c-di-GMP-binding flagellar brake protein YcgR
MIKKLNADYFTPGLPIQIEQQSGSMLGRLNSKIIGTTAPNFILAELPMSNGRPALLANPAQCCIRLVSDGIAIGFQATIKCFQVTPFPLVIFSYPEQYQKIVVRKRERIECCIEALLFPRPWASIGEVGDPNENGVVESADLLAQLPKEPYYTAVVDLSAGGCQVAIPFIDPLFHGEDIFPELRRQVPESQEMFYRSSRLVNVFTRGRVCELSCELPAPAGISLERVQVETRWINRSKHSLLVGLKFSGPVRGLSETVQSLVEYQLKYFKRPISFA